jgi:hypothetical protein
MPDDLLRFVPEGQQIAGITPEYKSHRNHRLVAVSLTLNNGESIRLKLF